MRTMKRMLRRPIRNNPAYSTTTTCIGIGSCGQKFHSLHKLWASLIIRRLFDIKGYCIPLSEITQQKSLRFAQLSVITAEAAQYAIVFMMGERRVQPFTRQPVRRLSVHPIHEYTTVVALVLLQIDLTLAPSGVDHHFTNEISSLPAVCGKAIARNPPLPPITSPHFPDIRTAFLNATA